jgi:cytochrome c-type biogenesis protein CcmH/NrfF
MRAEVRARLARGDEPSAIVDSYRARFGQQAIAIPSDRGLDRALWALPVAGILLAAGAIVLRARAWARTGRARTDAALQQAPSATEIDARYDERLEEELRRLEGE